MYVSFIFETGLSPRDLVFTFRHQIITLFKLLLLEKKILFRGASVGPLCSSLLTLISLLPLTLEYGLTESACVKTNKVMSIVPQFSSQSDADPTNAMDTLEDESPAQLQDSNSKPTTSSSSPMSEKMAKDVNNARIQDEAAVDKVDHSETSGGEVSNSKFYYSLDSNMKTSHSETSSLSSEKQADEIPDFITAVQMTPSDAGLPLKLFTKVSGFHECFIVYRVVF